MRVKSEHSIATKVLNYIRENKLESFCASDFACLEITSKQAKSALETLARREVIYHHGLESEDHKARVFYGTSKTPSKIVRAERIREVKVVKYFEGKLLGWQEVFPSMFNPVVLKGNKIVHKQAMV